MKITIALLICLTLRYANAGTLKAAATKIYIGTAVANDHLTGDAKYKALAESEFNMYTAENSMKWDTIESSQGKFNYAQGDAIVSFAKAAGGRVRGHTLVWHSQLPSYVSSLSKDAIKTEMLAHIAGEAGHYKGEIYAWDVVNEVFDESGVLRSSPFKNQLGEDFVSMAFKAASEADPAAKLYINDYNIEGKNSKSTGLYNLVAKLKNASVPIHGVGFQAHFSGGQIPSDFQANLQRFADLGLDVAITELDIKNGGAADWAKVFTTCKAVTRCVGVTIWGVIDKYSWITSGSPLVFDNNYAPKAAIHDAIEKALMA
jgi:endo-1,4-beta-xylanase